ncbi:MAG TPA: hypothetical protein VE779_17205 [Candidatus Angelobacter sp.]|nr:hypothetical protein [Candidatus Angelobacter sp.]
MQDKRLNNGGIADLGQEPSTPATPSKLTTMAARGLAGMFDVETRSFCFTLKRSQNHWVREGLSSRYTLMALLGVHRLEAAGFQFPIQLRDVVEAQLRSGAHATNVGDLGLALWLCALASPDELEEVYSSLNVRAALSDSREVLEGRTMELAWLLTGLAHARSVPGKNLPGLSELGVEIYGLLKNNQGAQGLFGHGLKKGTVAGALRGHIGSFADQVYPIYALAQFAGAFESRAAQKIALQCADAICLAQGDMGQWWWHYNSRTGAVFERYPVYAVHQHGMAPLALFGLTEATRIDFSEPIYKGLRWIAGENELGVDLRVASAGIVWRSVYNGSAQRKYFGNALGFLGFNGNDRAGDLKVNFECRPYEMGWLLYAFASRCS